MSPNLSPVPTVAEELFQEGSRTREQPQNLVFLVGGPTGAGKSAVVDKLTGITIVGKDMTREPRRLDSRSHVHISREEFEARKAAGHYLYDYKVPFSPDNTGQPALYGILRTVLDVLKREDVVVTITDSAGLEPACNAFRNAGVPVVPILLTPEKYEDLEARVGMRYSSKNERESRLAVVRDQHADHLALARVGKYTHILFNDTVHREREAWMQIRESWLASEGPSVLRPDDKMVAARANRIDKVYAKLAQVIAFYRATKGQVDTTNPNEVYKAYIGYCNLILFGEPDIDILKLRLRKQGRLRFAQPHFASSQPYSIRYITDKYWVTDIETPRKKKVVLRLNRKVNDSRKFDDYLRASFGPLGLFSTDSEKTRTFSITDRVYSVDSYAAFEIRYEQQKQLGERA